ncbi:MAG: primosomal replication protein N [Paraperlucidibaca sp.]
MEQNLLRFSGVIEKIYPRRMSPAGVAHQDFLMRHRSKQTEAGAAREVHLVLKVHVADDTVNSLMAFGLGDRLVAMGFLATASHRDQEQLVLHAQSLHRQD